ncbi:HupE/UreJ family protein [Neorhizobium sp. T786]|uniref:HupE/UreJ family protein n=1 Tax=Pseudorhizobium xiangyangii TaxID=2883104 RepID=UPI001CFFDE53|nr:HupE/UreJ family protein [Neorhizobium xiangyangii]MCB5204057.1 HupE/UreJ family protein [Neorhizobium xiangyangii]
MKTTILTATVVALTVNPAFAHLDPTEHGSFAAGFTHPVSGVDHIVVMVAVGLWAAMLGRQALFVVPATFLGLMILGFATAILGMPLPLVEPVILGSVVVLGIAVAVALPVWPVVGAMIVGFFAFFHGHAHGEEMGAAESISYGAGFVVATAMLHILGIAAGLIAWYRTAGSKGRLTIRFAGGAAALSGLMLMVG